MTPDAAQSFIEWQDQIVKSEHSEPVMSDLEGVIQSGWNTGSKQAQVGDIIK